MPVYKRGKFYHYSIGWDGKFIRVSTKSTQKKVAEGMEREHRSRLEQGQTGYTPRVKAKTVSDALTEIRSLKPGWSHKTATIHKNSQLAHLDPFFDGKMLSEVTADEIRRYQTHRIEQGASGRTCNIEVSLLRLAMRKAKLWANLADGPDPFKMLKERKDIGRELDDDECQRLLDACRSSASRALYPAVLLSIHTGLRNEELRMLQWKHIDFRTPGLTVGKSKTEGGSGRFVPLSNAAFEVLTQWRDEYPSPEPEHFIFCREQYATAAVEGSKGFPEGSTTLTYHRDPTKHIQTFATAWRTAKKTAKVECRWHDLRHTFVSLIAAGGATDGTLQALAGWMSPKMLERYSHVRNEAKRKAVSVLNHLGHHTKITQNKIVEIGKRG